MAIEMMATVATTEFYYGTTASGRPSSIRNN